MMSGERIDGAAIWANLDEATRAELGAIAVELGSVLMLFHRMNLADVDGVGQGLSSQMGRAAEVAEFETGQALMTRLMEGAPDLLAVQVGPEPRLPSLLGPVCRVCGCSLTTPCEGSGGRVEPDLCSVCAAIEGEPRA